MARYMTGQRKALLDYLSRHADEPLTAGEIARALETVHISRSAIYRNLAALEQEGQLRRSVKNGRREAVYQYCAAPSCRGHIHLSCTQCGRVFHLGTEATAKFIRGIDQSSGFAVNSEETVLFGLCENCQ